LPQEIALSENFIEMIAIWQGSGCGMKIFIIVLASDTYRRTMLL
jgi:hypothetical protein